MFVFIVPRTPVSYRNELRDSLWKLSLLSLQNQTSKNWKAIIVGDTVGENLDPNHFITLEFDEYKKLDKVKIALDHIEKNFLVKPDYVIRFDDDDIFSDSILKTIEVLPKKYDCYFDEYHTCIDLAYLKISYRKNTWIPNTAIHKYEHAIKVCGPENTILLIQDHSSYWHTYYKSKSVYMAAKSAPLYYRLLTPFSITSNDSSSEGSIAWTNHLHYLQGYGPWISLAANFKYFFQLNSLQEKFFSARPKMAPTHWLFNRLKYLKNTILNS